MSQSLRERIEGLKSICCGLIERSAVLDILAVHEREMVAAGLGVQPVAPPSEGVCESPAWRRELVRLRLMACDKDQIDLRHALLELYNLRCRILAGDKTVAIPQSVASHMLIKGGGCHPAGTWERDEDGFWFQDIYSADAAYLIAAIDAAGNGLLP